MSLDLLTIYTANAIRMTEQARYHLGSNTLLPKNWLNIDFAQNYPQGEFLAHQRLPTELT